MKNWQIWPSIVTYSVVEFYFKWQKTFEGNLLFRWVNSTLVTTKYSYLSARKKIYAYFETAFLKAPEATFVWCPWITIYSLTFCGGEKREVHLVQWPKEVNHFNKFFNFVKLLRAHLRNTWKRLDELIYQRFQTTTANLSSWLSREGMHVQVIWKGRFIIRTSLYPGELNQTSNNSVYIAI